MPALGFAAILVGAFLIRQVITGRVRDTPTDAKDIFLAALTGKPDEVGGVFARRGKNVDVADASLVEASPTGGVGASATSTLDAPSKAAGYMVSEAQRLGGSAQGYRLGATGPSYYDCSGLVWRVLVNLKLYNGPRFTTATFEHVATKFATPVDSPAVGDIVLWPGHHMGFVIGPDQLYSARDRTKGIGVSSISGDASYFKSQPEFWRVDG